MHITKCCENSDIYRFGGRGFIENDVFYNEKRRTPELPILSSSAVLSYNYFREYSIWIAFTKYNYFQSTWVISALQIESFACFPLVSAI